MNELKANENFPARAVDAESHSPPPTEAAGAPQGAPAVGIRVRSAMEIQRAHDILIAVLQGELPFKFSLADVDKATAAANALCWVLCDGHEESAAVFERALAAVDRRAAELGLKLRQTVFTE